MSKELDAIKNFIEISKKETEDFLSNVDLESVEKAAKLIIEAKKRGNRLHISGIGKPAHIAGYAASVISSTGTPTYFLHGTEAVHGSCGQLVSGDIVIMISNSGETAEMKATVNAIKKQRLLCHRCVWKKRVMACERKRGIFVRRSQGRRRPLKPRSKNVNHRGDFHSSDSEPLPSDGL